MKLEVLSKTSSGLPILDHIFGESGASSVLVLGGVHGDEPEGVATALSLLEQFTTSYRYSFKLHLIPNFNPDGILQKQRVNSRGVDLNRNMPTKDWQPEATKAKYPPGPEAGSEPETKALVQLLDAESFKFILSVHSFERYMIHTNGNCSPVAEILSEKTGYEIKGDIGYPTPGSLGTYAGLERNIPTITYEIQRGLALDKILKVHPQAIVAGLDELEKQIK